MEAKPCDLSIFCIDSVRRATAKSSSDNLQGNEHERETRRRGSGFT
jgi:hypothetical protein